MCPVCRARFRSATVCSRCGADLSPLMRLQVRAWLFRQAARRAILEDDAPSALQLAAAAESICHTAGGKALKDLSAWLNRSAAAARIV